MRPLHRTPVTVLHGTDKPVDLQGVSELAKVHQVRFFRFDKVKSEESGAP